MYRSAECGPAPKQCRTVDVDMGKTARVVTSGSDQVSFGLWHGESARFSHRLAKTKWAVIWSETLVTWHRLKSGLRDQCSSCSHGELTETRLITTLDCFLHFSYAKSFFDSFKGNFRILKTVSNESFWNKIHWYVSQHTALLAVTCHRLLSWFPCL